MGFREKNNSISVRVLEDSNGNFPLQSMGKSHGIMNVGYDKEKTHEVISIGGD